MPRDGSNIYHRPAGTDGIPNYPIESSKYNANVADVEQDLNLPRPIVAGGTGATNAADARFNLAAETATQIVTNYDSQIWTPGSFQSAVGATGAPNSTSVFAGTCYLGEALENPPTNQNVVIEARDISSPVKPGPVYTRQKTAGVWSAWGTTGGGSDAASNRAAIYAAPFDALAYNGMQINGSMEVSQEKGATPTTSNSYVIDGWTLFNSTTAVVSFSQQSYSSGQGFPKLIDATTTAAVASLPADVTCSLSQSIEGYRIARLAWGTANAQPITIAFMAAHHRPGTYSVSVRNFPVTRCYATTYTQNVADAWEYKTVTIPGDVAGTWAIDNTRGMIVTFTQAANGATLVPVAGVWTAGTYSAAPGQINAVAATSDVFRITGVVVLPGIEAPSAARSALIMRPYDQELVTCQRYLQMPQLGQIIGGVVTASVIFADVMFKTPMRAPPTFASPTGNTFYVSSLQTTTIGGAGILNFASQSGAELQFSGFSGLPLGGGACLWRSGTGPSMTFDARL